MFKILWALGLTIVSSTGLLMPLAHAQIIENFSDGNYSDDPAWSGDIDRFRVQDGRLMLLAPPENGTAFLMTPSQVAQGKWEFHVSLEFNPSSANYVRVYLTSDQPDLAGPVNGYFIMIGGTTDEVSLFRQDGNERTKIIDGTDGLTDFATVEIDVRVTCSAEGVWNLYTSVDGDDFQSQGSSVDSTHRSSSYFGIFCAYTSTRSDKINFDDVVVEGSSGPLPEDSVTATYKEIIISEFMADPTPAVGLPELEFVEIFNRSESVFNLAGYVLTDGATIGELPAGEIDPGEYLVLLSSDVDPVTDFPNTLAVNNFPVINNSGDRLILRNPEGIVVDSLNFNDRWYRDTNKKNGGWSLEIIDPANPCGEEDNWTASTAEAGGTPGFQNSVFANKPDIHGPKLTGVFPLNDLQIIMDFDEKLSAEPVAPEQISISPGVQVEGVDFFDHSLRSLLATLDKPLTTGTAYEIVVSRIRDCSNNLSSEQEPIVFALPEEADSLDIVINEILFNPFPGGSDFVEIFNRSKKFLNLAGWTAGHWNGYEVEDEVVITSANLLLSPGAFLVITPDSEDILTRYVMAESTAFFSAGLPSLPDEAGSIAITNAHGSVLDAVTYDEDLHSGLVVDVEGISLERISPDRSSQDSQNWKSSSADAGFATPGRENSNAGIEIRAGTDPVTVSPEAFQPVDGSPNFTTISYQFDRGGNAGTVRILDPLGRLVRELGSNVLLGTSGFFRWDGDRDDGSRARIGYYVVWFEVFNLDGTVQTFRKRVVIAAPF